MRPTQEDLAHAAADLEELAWRHDPRTARNSTGFPDLAALANLLVWADAEIRAARDAAAYGPGVKDGYHEVLTHRRSGHSQIDARAHDQYLKSLRDLRSGWLVELGQLADTWRQAAEQVGRFPDRSEQAG